MIWEIVPGLTIVWAILLIVQGILPGVVVYLTKLTIDGFLQGAGNGFSELSQILLYLIILGSAMLLNESLTSAGDWIRTAKAEYFSEYLKRLTLTKSVEVDLEFYESPAYHDLMEQAQGESQAKPLMLLESLGSVVQSAVTIAAFSVILFSYGWQIPVLLAAGTIPGLLINIGFDRKYHDWWKNRAGLRRWQIYFESMLSHSAAAAEMRLFNLGPRFREKFLETRAKLRREKLDLTKRQVAGKIFGNFLGLASFAAAVGWIVLKLISGLATVGDLAVFYQIFSRGQALMRSFLGGAAKAWSAGYYLKSLFDFLDLESNIKSPDEAAAFPEYLKKGIRFQNVVFKYPGGSAPVLKGLDLFIPAGKVAAIVGVNGAGKTTLLKLCTRFYDVSHGSITFDGVDIRKFNVDELRKNISVLFQFPMQFHETAGASISLGQEDAEPSISAVRQAAELAGADGVISSLPRGYETLLGKWFVDGCELSGGEWQRIALARAYYRRSPVIILDEPTSFMDSWAESEWFNRFRRLAEGRTGMIITHRFSIAMRADVIFVVDDGRLLEKGTHKELVQAGGFYARSWKTQKEESEKQKAGAALTAAGSVSV